MHTPYTCTTRLTQYYTHHSADMSNTNDNDNLPHKDSVTETTDVSSVDNRCNEINNIDTSDVVSINPSNGNNDSQNNEKEVTKRATD